MHPGVLVQEDFGPQGFEWTNPLSGVREPRPGTGITSGKGTSSEPYVISGWCFAGVGIHISGTTKHVIIRDNRLTGSGVHPDHVGVRIEDAANVQVQANHIQGWGYGIGAWRSTGILITSNQLEKNLRYGAWAAETPRIEITANSAINNENGLGIGFALDALVADNEIRSSGVVGVLNAFSAGAVLTRNRVSGGETGLYVREATDVIIADNDLVGQGVNGIAFDSAPRGLAELNRVQESGHEGIIFWGSPQGTARANEISGSGLADSRAAIRMAGSATSTVTNNMATGSAYGIVLDGSPRSLVSDNLVRGSRDAGMLLWANADTTIERNTLEANGIGIQIQQVANGIVVTRNNIHASTSGIGLEVVS